MKSKTIENNSPEKKKKPKADPTSSRKIIVLKLASRQKEDKERRYKFDKDRIVFGSVVSADVRLEGDGVSPIHAVLEVDQNGTDEPTATLFDLASDTGTFVNDKKVVAKKLKSQDQITIGRFKLKFSLEDFVKASKQENTREIEGRRHFLNPNEDFTPLLLENEREVEEIFDFRPTSKRALEIVMSWYGTILDIEHFVNEKNVTIGNTQKSDFGIPPLLSSGNYPIVTKSHDGFVLNLDTQMKGVIQRNGDLETLDEVRRDVSRGPNGYEVPLGNNDFAKISIGEIDFYFSYTAAPPRLKMRRIFERDPFFLKVFLFSMISTVLMLFTLSKVKLPQNVEPEQVPERIATILYQPEKFMRPPPVPTAKPTPKPTPTPVIKETPKPIETPPPQPKPTVKVVVQPKAQVTAPAKPLPKEVDYKAQPQKPAPQAPKPVSNTAKPSQQNRPAPRAEAKEGEGAKAKGPQGTRGEPGHKKNPVRSTEISRPSPHSGDKGASGESEVSDEGNVDILKGAGGKIQNILGNSAAKFGEGSQKLKGFGNFTSEGSGGLALSGSGKGGGGDAETTLGGLGNKGTGMGRVGTGKGAVGSGNGIVGAHARVAIRTDGPEEAVVMGAIDRDAIAEAILAHKDEFRLCYEREINAEHPSLSGQVMTSFVIGSSGRVTEAGVESSSLNNPNAEKCILKVLKRIEFPMPKGGGIVEVRFPFKFSSIGK